MQYIPSIGNITFIAEVGRSAQDEAKHLMSGKKMTREIKFT